MKILAIERTPSRPVEPWPAVRTYPDSAVLNRNLPLFLPDLPGQWTTTVYAVIRIGRLGKSIAEKFASRYYDAVTLGLGINPPGQWRGSQLAQCFDGAWVIGQWLETPRLINSVTINGVTEPADAAQWMLAKSVAAISRWMTLKTGDQIATCILADNVPIGVGTSFDAEINDTKVLHFHIR